MLKSVIAASAALTLFAVPALAEEHGDMAMTKGEVKLAKMLEGRVAGEPRSCIRTIGSRNLMQIDDTALVYRDGRTLWVNRTRNPGSIDDSDVMLIRRFSGTSLCRTDQIDMIDRYAGMLTGVIFLDDFVPYRLPEEEG
ncbi:hypothetical protein [Qipengyuania soli]|uniref:Uncharacterized protein n=1 Tax=Qipengyuania soli TaxID=2782568 RepID=A0A7S8F4H9_9SPHN|nr:hypothetical protein [Qipengyuania soli]QPC98950.1 hypothetical protein IRL76_14150 [Qipengyuania soli]